ncbi:MAG: adenylate/guanylate cyclase domain-containing protein [Deltaproteobacteria bacterium]|nr:adenylate/guanylate cyclase domain-containing protein [Deltaproteobacteria bacterium]MBK8715086.1 adenylate/guanylate cyclase domain-containing protein [Deltaproteobacteria bacterium]MBP7287102.1 adenylate/guanylate cyclase domain-containing protein [Nannocystaceae bacterium]
MNARTEVAPRPRVRFPLSLKLTIFAGALLIASIVGVGLAAMALTSDTVQTSQRELQIAVLQDVAHAITAEFTHAQDDLEVVGRTLTDGTMDEDARIDTAVHVVESSEALDHVAVYAADGSLITPILERTAAELGPPHELDAGLREVAARENLAVGEVVATALGPRVPVVVPLRAQERVTGFAATWLSTAAIDDRVESLADTHFTDVPGGVFVVDARRRVLAHPDRELVDSLATLPATGILDGFERIELPSRFSRASEFTTDDGVEMVGTVVALADRPWAVAAQTTRELAYAPVERMRNIVLITIAVAIVLAIGASVVLSRRVTSPLEQLSAYAGAIARREFDSRIDIQTQDEVALLARAMTRAADDLRVGEQRLQAEHAIRADLGRYLPAELVDKVVRREQDMALGGQRVPLTVMFADVVAFTPLTEKLPPEQVVQLLNELFTIITEIVFRHGGTIDKFVGDCVMALWGAPTALPDHAARAAAAAEEILSWLEAGNAGWQRSHGVQIQIAIGINSGEAVVGNIGSERRMEYTAIGDVVNVAARLEAIARPQQVLVTAETRRLAGDRFRFVELGPRPIAGRAEPLVLYELVP